MRFKLSSVFLWRLKWPALALNLMRKQQGREEQLTSHSIGLRHEDQMKPFCSGSPPSAQYEAETDQNFILSVYYTEYVLIVNEV